MTPEEKIEFHYRLEKELSRRIRAAPCRERARVTLEAYDELFRRIPWHDGHLESAGARAAHAAVYAGFKRFRSPLFRNRAYAVSTRAARLAEVPAQWKQVCEAVVEPLPVKLRRRLAKLLRLNILIEAYRG